MEVLRLCKRCERKAHNVDELEYFTKRKDSKHGRNNLCKQCANDHGKGKGRDWKTDHQTRKRYGVGVAEYKKRMATSASCECCGSEENLCYDHCHETMKFRGVLCRSCNAAIGQLGDRLEDIRRAVAYLERALVRPDISEQTYTEEYAND